MGSAALASALKVRMANDFDRTANSFGVQPLSSTTTHAATALPAEYSGRYVLIYIPTGGVDIFFACSKKSTAEVDRSVAATTTFPAVKTGQPLPAGQLHQLKLPDWDLNEIGYLCYESSATQTFYLTIGDGA